MFCLLKADMLKEDALWPQIVVLLKNSSQKRKQANLLITTNLALSRGLWTKFLICFKNWIFPAQIIFHFGHFLTSNNFIL